MDQALESQWIAGAGQLGAEFFNGIDPLRSFAQVAFQRITWESNRRELAGPAAKIRAFETQRAIGVLIRSFLPAGDSTAMAGQRLKRRSIGSAHSGLIDPILAAPRPRGWSAGHQRWRLAISSERYVWSFLQSLL
jgi:hypothetical protein